MMKKKWIVPTLFLLTSCQGGTQNRIFVPTLLEQTQYLKAVLDSSLSSMTLPLRGDDLEEGDVVSVILDYGSRRRRVEPERLQELDEDDYLLWIPLPEDKTDIHGVSLRTSEGKASFPVDVRFVEPDSDDERIHIDVQSFSIENDDGKYVYEIEYLIEAFSNGTLELPDLYDGHPFDYGRAEIFNERFPGRGVAVDGNKAFLTNGSCYRLRLRTEECMDCVFFNENVPFRYRLSDEAEEVVEVLPSTENAQPLSYAAILCQQETFHQEIL